MSDTAVICQRLDEIDYERVSSGLADKRAFIVSHHNSCQSQRDTCYLRGYKWRNPYEITWEGVSRFVWIPECQDTFGIRGPIAGAMEVFGRFVGRAVVADDKIARPELVLGSDVHSRQSTTWRECVLSAETVITSTVCRYVVEREVIRRFAKCTPRQKCRCGKRLPRGYKDESGQHTYLVSDPPFLKIGRTINLRNRWGNGYVTDNPRQLKVLRVLCGDREGELHSRFEEYRRVGEWFRDVPSIREAFGLTIPEVAQALPLFT